MGEKNLVLRKLAFSDNFQFDIRKKSNVEFNKYKLGTTLHWHDHFEMEFIYGGSGIHLLNDRKYEIHRGSVYLLTPADFHTVIPDGEEKLSLYSIRFGESVPSPKLYETVMNSAMPSVVEFGEEEFGEVCRALDAIIGEMKGKEEFREEKVTYLFNVLLISYLRKREKNGKKESPENTAAESVAQKAVSYIKYNFKDKTLSTRALAERLHLTANYFGEIFRRETGTSCVRFIKDMRMKFAVGLLVNSDMPVSEIADNCGYSSDSYFIKEFREEYGVSPRQYRDTYYSNQKE